MRAALLLVLIACVCACASAQSPAQPRMVLSYGAVDGFYTTASNGVVVEVFLGIPYAYAERFGYPQPPLAWIEPLNATRFVDPCPQRATHLPVVGTTLVAQSTNEDCLRVNVFRAQSATRPAPTYVFFPGGAFTDLDPTLSDLFDGVELAARATVTVITAAYRTNLFGYLPIPGVPRNLGLRDQQRALRFIELQSSGLGVDLTRVTLGGQSAGSISLCLLMVSPFTPVFPGRAILESGACSTPLPLPDGVPAQAVLNATAAAMNCSSAGELRACLSAMSALDIVSRLHLVPEFSFGPVLDPDSIPDQPVNLLAHGSLSLRLDVIIGSVASEGSVFFHDVTDEQFVALTDKFFGTSASAAVRAEYTYGNGSASAFPSATAAIAAAFGDFVFNCNAYRTMALLAAQQRTVRMYYWTQAPMWNPIAFVTPDAPLLPNTYGAYHTSELPFVWHSPRLVSDEQALSGTVTAYWGSFMTSNEPVASPVAWPVALAAGTPAQPLPVASVLQLHRDNVTVVSAAGFLASHRCAFWATANVTYPELPPSDVSLALLVAVPVVVGVLVIVIIILSVCACCRRRMRRARSSAAGRDRLLSEHA